MANDTMEGEAGADKLNHKEWGEEEDGDSEKDRKNNLYTGRDSKSNKKANRMVNIKKDHQQISLQISSLS